MERKTGKASKERTLDAAISRRRFVKGAGIVTAGLLGMGLAGCSSGGSSASGGASSSSSTSLQPFYVGQTNLLKALTPTDSSVPWSLTSDGVSESIYMLDANGNLKSRYISTLTQKDDLTWMATLTEDAKFSDGTAVDAAALCACLNQIQAENNLSNASAGKITYTKTGDYALSIVTTTTTKTMQSVLAEWSEIVFKKMDDGTYIFSGPYAVKNLDSGVQLDLVPNSYYPNADKRSDVTVKAFKDASAMQLAFESGEIDMAFTVTPDVKGTLEGEGYKVTGFDAGYQYFAYVNTKSADLADIQVRQAINYATNRDDMVTALKGGQVATGLFAHYYSFAGTSKVVCDTAKAKSLLDAAGWMAGSDGMRMKDGRKLSLKLVTYSSRPDLSVLMQLAASQLKTIGIEVSTAIVENVNDTAKNGDYDVLFYAQHTAPTGNPVSYLSQAYKTGSSNNYTGYSSSDFDGVVTQMATLPAGAEMDKLAIQAQEILFNDAPVVFLVDPQWYVALSDRLENYVPYCGDYYVINAQMGIS